MIAAKPLCLILGTVVIDYYHTVQNLENILPTLESDSFTNALSELNMDKNRYENRIPCIYISNNYYYKY